MAGDIVWGGGSIRFSEFDGEPLPSGLFGMLCANRATAAGLEAVHGPAVVVAGGRMFQGAGIRFKGSAMAGDNALDLTYAAGDGLEIVTAYRYDAGAGVLRRTDRLRNVGNAPARVRRFHARLALPPDVYDVYFQSGRWACENQGRWVPLHAGSIVLGCEEGRTTQGNPPYACVRPAGAATGLVVHLVPCGNWTIKICARPGGHGNAFCVLETGMAEDLFEIALQPGEVFEAPALLLQELTGGQPHLCTAALHRHVNAALFGGLKSTAPVIYNTWLDMFDYLDERRLRERLPLLKHLGVDVVEVDAGWYGRGGINQWHSWVGDWRENPDRSFFGRMKDFVKDVKQAGLAFGLFMEPETVGASVPLRQEHPEWFVGGGARLDLVNPKVYAYLQDEISRLIETYDLRWMRLDLNSRLGYDETGSELHDYYRALGRLYREIHAQYPALFMEQCASGGMRYDLESLQWGDGYYLSDSQNPVDMIRNTEGAYLRLPPGRSSRMLALRTIGTSFPGHPVDPDHMPETLVTTPAVGWQPAQYPESYDLDFAAIVTMLGVMGVSGDPSSFSKEKQERLRQHIAFYKRWQPFILTSCGHLLTEPKPVTDRTGYSAFQLCNERDARSLVYVFRLQDVCARRRLRLRGLDRERLYRLSVYPTENPTPVVEARGGALMDFGLDVALPKPASAVICMLEPAT